MSFSISCQEKPVTQRIEPEEEIAPVFSAEEQLFIKNYLQHLHRVQTEYGIPGIGIAVVHQDKTLIVDGIGRKAVDSDSPVNGQTLFRLGSLSKGVAALLTARMVEKGVLTWDTKVKDVIPEFLLSDSLQSERITVQHLLSHSTGLPYHCYTNLVEAGQDIATIIDNFNKVKLLGREGNLCAYQNAAYTVIETMLEKLTDKNIEDLYQSELFDPSGMCRASVTYHKIEKDHNKAYPHRRASGSKYYKRRISHKYYNSISSGGVNASPADMAHYMQVLLGNRSDILTQSSLDSIFNPFVPTPGSRYFDKWADRPSSYGMGWRILDYHGHHLAYHGGYVNNYRTEIALDLENKIGICLLFNGNIRYAKSAIPQFFEIWENVHESGSITGI